MADTASYNASQDPIHQPQTQPSPSPPPPAADDADRQEEVVDALFDEEEPADNTMTSNGTNNDDNNNTNNNNNEPSSSLPEAAGSQSPTSQKPQPESASPLSGEAAAPVNNVVVNGSSEEIKHEAEVSEDQPPSKRLKTEDSEEKPPGDVIEGSTEALVAKPEESEEAIIPKSVSPTAIVEQTQETSPSFPKHQQKFALSMVRSLKKLKDAGPFLVPVDPIKFNIPDYPKFITNPMDLSTIDSKLKAESYNSVDEFVDDFKLIVSNCIKFNGVESKISDMARSLQASFDRQFKNFPPKELPKPAPSVPKPVVKKKTQPARAASSKVTPTQDDSFALTPSGIPTIRRYSTTANDGRPKREIHPPKNRDLPYADVKPKKKKYAAELRFCGNVLKELTSKKHESYSFPFLQPVDPVALNCPTYFKVIKHPMDLSTIQHKYKTNQYETADDFEDDIRLMFKNCYKFNPEGSPVNMMGHRLEMVFDKKFTERPPRAETPPATAGGGGNSSDEDSEEEGDDTAISFLEQQLEQMRSELSRMKKSKGEKKKHKDQKHGSSTSMSTAPKGRGKKSKQDNIQITYEMKRDLSEKINTLTGPKLNQVVQIINESMPHLSNGEEIELDIDQLDSGTVLKLYNFAFGKPPPQSRTPPQSVKVPNKNRKNKPLSEGEQRRQIEFLTSKIREYQDRGSSTNAGAGAGGGGSDGSSSSEDESDNESVSSSEEE